MYMTRHCMRAGGGQEMKKSWWGHLKKIQAILIFESGANVGSDAARSDWQKELQVGLLL